MAVNSYRLHTGGSSPSEEFIEDAVANVIAAFSREGHQRYDSTRGRLRGILRMQCNARVVDLLRKQRPFDHVPYNPGDGVETDSHDQLPVEDSEEREAFQRSILATLIEDLRNQIPIRQFEIFEMVKLKGMPPDLVAAELGVKRGLIDNNVYKVMSRLRDMARAPEYLEEYYQ